MRGNHENYGFLSQYFNKYLLSANKNNIYCMMGKQRPPVLPSVGFIVDGLYCLLQRALLVPTAASVGQRRGVHNGVRIRGGRGSGPWGWMLFLCNQAAKVKCGCWPGKRDRGRGHEAVWFSPVRWVFERLPYTRHCAWSLEIKMKKSKNQKTKRRIVCLWEITHSKGLTVV